MLSPKHLSNTSVNMPIDFSNMFLYVSMNLSPYAAKSEPLLSPNWNAASATSSVHFPHRIGRLQRQRSSWGLTFSGDTMWFSPSILNGKPWVFISFPHLQILVFHNGPATGKLFTSEWQRLPADYSNSTGPAVWKQIRMHANIVPIWKISINQGDVNMSLDHPHTWNRWSWNTPALDHIWHQKWVQFQELHDLKIRDKHVSFNGMG